MKNYYYNYTITTIIILYYKLNFSFINYNEYRNSYLKKMKKKK